MSDAPQGPGWWQATDGRWYPPKLPPPQLPPGVARKITLWIVAGVVGLLVLLVVCTAATEDRIVSENDAFKVSRDKCRKIALDLPDNVSVVGIDGLVSVWMTQWVKDGKPYSDAAERGCRQGAAQAILGS